MPPLTILLTGSRGAIGGVIADALRSRGHRVRGYDRGEPAHADDLRGDLLDGDALRAAARGAQAIVHLAATPDEADFVTDLVPNNVVGTHLVLEAARLEGVGRVVLASTLRAVSPWKQETPLTADVRLRPHDLYSWTKAGVELMGELYADRHGLAVLAARLGMFVRGRDGWETLAGWKDRRSYLSWSDARRFFACAVEAELAPGFAAIFVTSRGGASLCDLEGGRRLIGFEPQDEWPEGTPELA